MGERGQAYTLEAFIAALLLVSSLTFALQVTAVTPLSASTANQHIENQQRSSASGVLAAADERGALEEAVLYWDHENETFHDPTRLDYYTNDYPPNTFGEMLDRAFGGRGLAVNVFVHTEGDRRPQQMVYHGEPSDNAASASRTVTLYDDDWVRDENGDPDQQVSDVPFYTSDAHPDSLVYNVVRVEVVVWRM
jgi:hypothetical protein